MHLSMAAAVLILWMCYCVHKHNTSHHPAVREGLEYEGVVGGVGDAAETSGTSAGGEGRDMSTNRWGEARGRYPTYMEVGGGGGREGSTFQLKEKEAYRLIAHALQLKQILLVVCHTFLHNLAGSFTQLLVYCCQQLVDNNEPMHNRSKFSMGPFQKSRAPKAILFAIFKLVRQQNKLSKLLLALW